MVRLSASIIVGFLLVSCSITGAFSNKLGLDTARSVKTAADMVKYPEKEFVVTLEESDIKEPKVSTNVLPTSGSVETIERWIARHRSKYCKENPQRCYAYRANFIMIDLYPFFCDDSAPRITGYKHYSKDGTFSTLESVESGDVNSWIAVETHISRGSKMPYAKTYRLFHLSRRDYDTTWAIIGKPRVVNFKLVTDSTYNFSGCRD